MKPLVISGAHWVTFWREQVGWPIWAMNESACWRDRIDAAFQLHPPEVYRDLNNPKEPHYWSWLRREHDFPIYMIDVDPDVPASARFPFDEVADLQDGLMLEGQPVKLFNCTLDYMIGLAIVRGYNYIQLIGFEFGADYEDQRFGAGMWSGIALGYGVKLDWYCAHGIFQRGLYGYETFHRTPSVQWYPLEVKNESSISERLPTA